MAHNTYIPHDSSDPDYEAFYCEDCPAIFWVCWNTNEIHEIMEGDPDTDHVLHQGGECDPCLEPFYNFFDTLC